MSDFRGFMDFVKRMARSQSKSFTRRSGRERGGRWMGSVFVSPDRPRRRGGINTQILARNSCRTRGVTKEKRLLMRRKPLVRHYGPYRGGVGPDGLVSTLSSVNPWHTDAVGSSVIDVTLLVNAFLCKPLALRSIQGGSGPTPGGSGPFHSHFGRSIGRVYPQPVPNSEAGRQGNSHA